MGIFYQTVEGTLGPEEVLPFPDSSFNVKGLAIADISGDGLIDIIGTDFNDHLVVLRQSQP